MAWRAQGEDAAMPLLVFDRQSGAVVDLDLRGRADDVASRYAAAPSSRGRPRLGVVAREVTLLPRHWEWLARQGGGASVALRRLVEAALRAEAESERGRMEAAYRFMSALAGDLVGFEEAARSLFAHDGPGLEARLAAWPRDIAEEVRRMRDGDPSVGPDTDARRT